MAFDLKRFITETVDPRKVASGTTLQAKGTVPVPPKSMEEIGSATPTRLPDVVPQFSNRAQMLRTFKEMEDGDTTFDVALRAAKVPVQGASFFIQPYDKKQLNKDVAEFVDYNVFHSTSRPFVLVLEDVLRMFNDGWALLEPVWETREWSPKREGANRKKYTMLKKLAARPASTISEIIYDDNGGPTSVKQQAIRADGVVEEVEIPIDKLLIFTFGGVGGDLMGKPLGRTAYQPWYFKKELYKIDAIGHERNRLGVPVWSLAETYTKADVDAAWEQVTNVRTNEKTGVVEPPNHKFRFETVENNPTDIMNSIEHHDSKILLNVMAQFLLLGITGGGGRATSGSHVDMFQKAMKYIANYICGVFNLYLIPRIVGYNFNISELPQMRVRNVGETKDLQMWASAHANLASQGLITYDFETENWYRDELDMPYKLEENVAVEEEEPLPPSAHNGNANGRGSVATENVRTGTGNTGTTPGAESVS